MPQKQDFLWNKMRRMQKLFVEKIRRMQNL